MKTRHHMLAWDGDMVYIHSWPGVMQRQHEGIFLLADKYELFNRRVHEWFYGSTDYDIEAYVRNRLLK